MAVRRGSEEISVLSSLCSIGKFKELVQVYNLLSTPTAEDDYWAGIGFAALGAHGEAVSLLNRSLERGHPAAAAPLANIASEHNEFEYAQNLLDSLQNEVLSGWDEAIASREQGKLLESAGNFSEATAHYRAAWEKVCFTPGTQILLAPTGQSLAWLLHLMGQSLDAIEILRETERSASPNRQAQLLHLHMLASIASGNLQIAQELQVELEFFVPYSSDLVAFPLFAAGELEFAKGNWAEAMFLFEQCTFSLNSVRSEITFAAHLSASRCAFALRDSELAQTQLEQAEGEIIATELVLTPVHANRARANLLLQKGVLALTSGRFPEAAEMIGLARDQQHKLGLQLGEALALLHLANLQLQLNTLDEAAETLRSAYRLAALLQSKHQLAHELQMLPELTQFAQERSLGQNLDRTPLNRLVIWIGGNPSLEITHKLRQEPLLQGCEISVMRAGILRVRTPLAQGIRHEEIETTLDELCEVIEAHDDLEVEEIRWER